MFKKINTIVKNFCLLTIPSIIIFILFLEFVIFESVFPASDMPYRYNIASPDDVVRCDYRDYGMYHSGVYRKGYSSEIKAHYNINQEGWNSNKEYFEQRSGKKRIAVIGDSFVEAMNIDVDSSLSEVLEGELIKNIGGGEVEVYRFGFSGASLSQYLHMMRYVKNKFNPDIVIVVIVHNDFLESIYGFGNPDGDFLQFTRNKKNWVEVKPRPYVYTPDIRKMALKKSRIIRFLYYNLNFKQTISLLISRFKHEKVYMNISMNEVSRNLDMIKSVCRHIFSEYKETLGNDTKLLLVMDGDREAIYEGKDPTAERLYVLNKIASSTADQLSIPFIDLNDVFAADYKNNRQPFDCKIDKHWNKRAHLLVGKAISKFIRENKW